ncbi:hypothetical protein HaLaN_21426 [Haematococcus lacustris]|uniref:Uncharacterized protein n=1 Tax=Haematococcus lacustris TaxID=44745 RepID=A0A699ZNJ9_HAELA|nr:hypothetical protein HaLaN_21426 [Haematococcus lacustris]
MAMGMWDGGWMDDVESDDDIEVVIALSILPLLLAAILPLVADLAPPQQHTYCNQPGQMAPPLLKGCTAQRNGAEILTPQSGARSGVQWPSRQ